MNSTPTEERGGLLSYLARLGLGDADLTRVVSLLQAAQAGLPTDLDDTDLDQDQTPGPEPYPDTPPSLAAKTARDTITLYLAEEQQILKEAYHSFFSGHPTIEMLGSSTDTSSGSLIAAVSNLKPRVLLLGVKTVQPETVEKLELLREACPQVSLVLLFAFYDVQGIKALRGFSQGASAGCAYLLKHTIDTVEQLTQVLSSVAQGRVMMDPLIMEELIRTGEPTNSFLSELSARELEVLSWMAKGYRNDTIAQALSRDVKTVERHINNIYSKMQHNKSQAPDQSLHPRVRAALIYLRATGLLPPDQFIQDS